MFDSLESCMGMGRVYYRGNRDNGVNFDRHPSNCGDGDSIDSSTAVAVTEFAVMAR